jgi:outer membrane translocation and assembly module TamA
MQKIIFSISFILLALSSQAQSGIFVGVGSNFYKSNLFNLDDSRAKEDLDYVRTFNASYGIELGYRFNSRWGISIEPQWAKNNQKYMGKTRVSTGTSGYSFTVDALVKTEYIKIPISVQKELLLNLITFNKLLKLLFLTIDLSKHIQIILTLSFTAKHLLAILIAKMLLVH